MTLNIKEINEGIITAEIAEAEGTRVQFTLYDNDIQKFATWLNYIGEQPILPDWELENPEVFEKGKGCIILFGIGMGTMYDVRAYKPGEWKLTV